MFTTPITFLFWVATNVIGIGIYYLGVRPFNVSKKTYERFNKYITFCYNEDNDQYFFEITHYNLTRPQQVVNMIVFVMLMMNSFYYANVNERFNDWSDLWYLFYMLFVVVFGLIEEIKMGAVCLDPKDLKHLTLKQKIFLGCLSVLILTLVGYHIWLATFTNYLWWYISALVVVPSLYVAMYIYLLRGLLKDKPKFIDDYESDERSESEANKYKVGFHIHHWFVGFACSLFFRFDTFISKSAFLLFYSVFIQGALSFGIVSILY